ncbi:MAG: LytTR family DNA-binding domain-containing protein [Pseudomonadota bacterium]
MAQLDASSPVDENSEPISVLSAGAIGLESGCAPLRFTVQIFAFAAGAVLIVHLFLDTRLGLVDLAAHAVALSLLYTLAFAAAYAIVGAFWRRTRSVGLPQSAFIWAVCLSAVGLGVAISQGLSLLSGAFGETLNAHQEANFIPRLIPVWAIIVVLLIQNEKRRLLSLELSRNPALKSGVSIGNADSASAAPGDVIRLRSGRSQFTLHPEQITYVVAEGNYCSIHFTNPDDRAPLMLRSTFSHLIDQLPPEIFTQIHRSYVVNNRHVKNIDISATASAVVLSNAMRLPISRARLAEARSRFKEKLATPDKS